VEEGIVLVLVLADASRTVTARGVVICKVWFVALVTLVEVFSCDD